MPKVAMGLERFPVRWNHLTDEKPLQIQPLERFSPVRHDPIPTKTALAERVKDVAQILVLALALSGCTHSGLFGLASSAQLSGYPKRSVATWEHDASAVAPGGTTRDVLAEAQGLALASPGSGAAVDWAKGHLRGRITAGPIYMVNERTCRELTHASGPKEGATPGREAEHVVLCMEPGGRWEPVR